tara:strand:- start:54 stop:722 length:669 start_codon:yes stop_codon:yes gene_type:complete
MREVVLDTETTGLNPSTGDRIVEIGCVELLNHVATGKSFHQYVNPQRPMPDEAFRVHGLSDEFLADQPAMSDVMADFIEFIGDAPLIIHNADFDMRFINAELNLLGETPLQTARAVDTVRLAREKFPGAPASLDALCKRFGIDNSSRTLHGALLDAQLLAEVYLELIGGRQPDFELAADRMAAPVAARDAERRDPRPHAASEEELAAHKAFVEKLKHPIWSS